MWDNKQLARRLRFLIALLAFNDWKRLVFIRRIETQRNWLGHFTNLRFVQPEEMAERDVYCCNQGGRWHFEQHGTPLPGGFWATLFETTPSPNEESMMALLERIGTQPWREDL